MKRLMLVVLMIVVGLVFSTNVFGSESYTSIAERTNKEVLEKLHFDNPDGKSSGLTELSGGGETRAQTYLLTIIIKQNDEILKALKELKKK